MEFQYHISEMTAETDAADFVKEFVQVEKFLSACQQCPNYNTRWTCPPFDFDPMTIWSGYTTLRLYARSACRRSGSASGRSAGGAEAGKAPVPGEAVPMGAGGAGQSDAAGGHLRPV